MESLNKKTLPELKQYAIDNHIKKYSNKPKLMLINHILSEMQKEKKVETPKKIYCGINKLNKNQRYGTEQECWDRKEVNRYGQFKVSDKLMNEHLELISKKKVVVKKPSKFTPKETLLMELSGLRGKLKNITGTSLYKKTPEFIENLNKDKSEVESKIKSVIEQLNKLIS